MMSGRPHSRHAPGLALSLLVVVGVAISACGGSAATSGEAVIEGELADAIGLGELEATCNEPDGLSEGETFTCTATAAEGGTVEFLGTMTSDDVFDIATTNLLTADDVVGIREEGARVLSVEVGQEILVDDIVCPDAIVLLDESGVFVCEITDTSTGAIYELSVSTGGIEPGVGVRDLAYTIGDEPL
jgi:hypothetical protein